MENPGVVGGDCKPNSQEWRQKDTVLKGQPQIWYVLLLLLWLNTISQSNLQRKILFALWIQRGGCQSWQGTMAVNCRHGSWELRSSNHQHWSRESKLAWREAWNCKPTPSDAPPPEKSHLLGLPKQVYLMGTECSNAWAYGGTFLSQNTPEGKSYLKQTNKDMFAL